MSRLTIDSLRFGAQVRAHSVKVEAYSHMVDAFRYAAGAFMPDYKPLPLPPVTPDGLTPEQHAAHLALHDLVSVGEFERLSLMPSFSKHDTYRGSIGGRIFTRERTQMDVAIEAFAEQLRERAGRHLQARTSR